MAEEQTQWSIDTQLQHNDLEILLEGVSDIEHNEEEQTAAAARAEAETEENGDISCHPPSSPVSDESEYIDDDTLHKHIRRQSNILLEAFRDALELPTSIAEVSRAYERNLFCPLKLPKKQENGTVEPNPRLNFYPTFITPETLATYHLFFQNQKIPLSCKVNRPKANQIMKLSRGARIPDFPTVEQVRKIFEGLGDEQVSKNALQQENSHLIELEYDPPRAAVLKRNTALTHFAYPAVNLPPKIMSCVMDTLVMKHVESHQAGEEEEADSVVVSDEELLRWLQFKGTKEEAAVEISEKRKTMMAVVLVSSLLQCLKRFFTSESMIKKIGETLHYTFHHGYVKQAIKISNVDLTNIVSYMGILHENRVGHSTLHKTLKGENRMDYVRDTIFLWLIYTWQTAMGVWQQCMDDNNLKELQKILQKAKKNLWTEDNESYMSKELSAIIFPDHLLETLQKGLPDLTNQSMIQHFRDFILERSGILPAMCTALPTDFVPLTYHECPPPLWAYTYFLQLANYFMYHNDLHVDSSGEGVLDCYCRCNLCTPHRCLATNTALLNEVQLIGTFELQGPPSEDGKAPAPLKLTSGLWTSAYLRKFNREDYYPFTIQYYEDHKNPRTKAELSACVITQSKILAQLQNIKKAREEFLLKKGHGVYIDPQTGEELNTAEANSIQNGTQTRDNNTSTRSGGGGEFNGGEQSVQSRHRPRRRRPYRSGYRVNGNDSWRATEGGGGPENYIPRYHRQKEARRQSLGQNRQSEQASAHAEN
ncbi:100 kDa protein [red squirrel adenovirus 1]|uniref:Shutoff protein n=1 Tax=red squirrel adenovirus 1 TaxID=2773314 RepID=A0A240FBG6_9ADEN|nr:100 kDa protein [red squirrel adenovirus 1]ARE31892.1 100 kDa protein [red squirrel adenovirus 1]WUG45433.1 100K [Squirrel mastadenovirus A]